MNEILSPLYNIMAETNKTIFSLGDFTGFVIGLILIASVLALAFWGYKLKKITLAIIGFIIGASLGVLINKLIKTDNTVITTILIIMFGIIGASLNYFLYYASIFIIGIFLGGILGLMIGVLIEASIIITIILGLILAIIGGALSIKRNKVMFIICTAYYGYILFRMGFYSVNVFGIDRFIEELTSLCILVAAIFFQFIDNMNKGNDKATN